MRDSCSAKDAHQVPNDHPAGREEVMPYPVPASACPLLATALLSRLIVHVPRRTWRFQRNISVASPPARQRLPWSDTLGDVVNLVHKISVICSFDIAKQAS